MLKEDAIKLLQRLDCSPRLLCHAKLVTEIAVQMSAELKSLGVIHDENLVEVGAVLHDSGKIYYPNELSGPGSAHESAGEQLLLKNGVEPGIARFCRSHGKWHEMPCTIEEYIVALADKLWKGVRSDALELTVIDEVAKKLGKTRWDLFVRLDSYFEKIAAGAVERLQKAKSY